MEAITMALFASEVADPSVVIAGGVHVDVGFELKTAAAEPLNTPRSVRPGEVTSCNAASAVVVVSKKRGSMKTTDDTFAPLLTNSTEIGPA